MKKVNTLNAASITGRASVAWSFDGQWLATNHPDDSIGLYHITRYPHALEAEPRFTLETGPVTQLQWVADRSLAITDNKNHISIWDMRISRKVFDILPSASDLRAWNADFTVMVEAEGNQLRLGKMVETSLPCIQHVQLSADGSTAVVITSNHQLLDPSVPYREEAEEKWPIGGIEVWNVAQSERLFLQHGVHMRAATWLNVSPNGKHRILRGIYLGSDGIGDTRREFVIDECVTSKRVYRSWGIWDDVPDLPTWDAAGQQVLYWDRIQSLSKEHTEASISLFDIPSGKESKFSHKSLGSIKPASLAWHPNKDLVAIGDESGSIHVYNLQPEIGLLLATKP